MTRAKSQLITRTEPALLAETVRAACGARGALDGGGYVR